MNLVPKYQPPLDPSYIPSRATKDSVPAAEARSHILELRDSGLDRVRLSALTGVHRSEISALLACDPKGAPRRALVDAKVADALLLVRTNFAGLDPNTRMLAVGAQRRVQALARVGHSIEVIARWLRTGPDTLERLLRPETKVATVRAHRAIAAVFSTHWMVGPEQKDPATIARAEAAGWQSPLAWDDIDFDLIPAATTLRAVRDDDVDEVAVDLALEGHHVPLGPVERRIVVGKAHEQQLSDNAISALTGIPLTTVWNIRQDLGLEPWNEPTREYKAA